LCCLYRDEVRVWSRYLGSAGPALRSESRLPAWANVGLWGAWTFDADVTNAGSFQVTDSSGHNRHGVLGDSVLFRAPSYVPSDAPVLGALRLLEVDAAPSLTAAATGQFDVWLNLTTQTGVEVAVFGGDVGCTACALYDVSGAAVSLATLSALPTANVTALGVVNDTIDASLSPLAVLTAGAQFRFRPDDTGVVSLQLWVVVRAVGSSARTDATFVRITTRANRPPIAGSSGTVIWARLCFVCLLIFRRKLPCLQVTVCRVMACVSTR
jgi:hypothetical protein